MTFRETPFFIDVGGEALLAIVTEPCKRGRVGVVIVVGGPQYRVGSHRQFVLFARALAIAGIACLRFDYRGMGDSEGATRDFSDVNSDIRAAIDAFCARFPSIDAVILWGLCDGATAISFYGGDPRVAGLALCNPWARTIAGESSVVIKSYYVRRVLSSGFWAKMARGKLAWRQTAVEFANRVLSLRSRASSPARSNAEVPDLPVQIAQGLGQFDGPVLILLSGNDLVAAEFKAHAIKIPSLASVVAGPLVRRVEFADADHTFSSNDQQAALMRATIDWIRAHFQQSLDSPSAEAK